ncbi:SDR family NAD(P)-dependent oxidoreductase [Amycolatopsis aidingensis]|uniref:SDR family NAD(P)-dependent oxidoreductase n=1 Tax=Amycolatopsis aidingensis TaxID=2842453 RepID=UPI001C0B401F|nr:SDR family NAD(P)-dependent oxidoreductase [Amycolatopsis aidingensis]
MTTADIDLFAEASGDHNPLHTSPDYARRTPFGKPVAHGVLAAVAALDELVVDGDGIDGADVEFRQPIQPGVTYKTTVCQEGNRIRVSVSDGATNCLSMTLSRGSADDMSYRQRPHRREPRVVTAADVTFGLSVAGNYGPGQALDALCERWPIAVGLLGRFPLTCLLWCSFLAGMELPGRDCLLNGFSLRLYPAARLGPLELSYTTEVADFDPRFGLLSTVGHLHGGGAMLAEAKLETLVRSPVPAPSAERIREALPSSDRLRGHTSAVVGGSRGLGAALVLALASQGGRVLVGHRGASGDIDELVTRGEALGGQIVSCPGEATSTRWSQEIAHVAGNALDLLVCSAAPPIRPLQLDPAGLGRIQEFVADAFALVSAPMAGLLDTVDRARGRCLVVSSSAVVAPPADWPHYVAAKHAAEGLTHWAAERYPGTEFFVARPRMLLTDQVNTPAGRDGAANVEPVAAAMVRRLVDSAPAIRRPELMSL